MKKLALFLAAATVITCISCGTDHNTVISYVARSSSDSWAPHLFVLDVGKKTSKALSIPIPANADYVTVNSSATEAAYCYSGDTGWDIYIMGKDGKEKQLTTNANACEAAFSPNGKLIAYVSGPAGDYQIFTMNIDGSNQKAVYTATAGTLDQWMPQFSPDSKSVVFFITVNAPPPAPIGAQHPSGLRRSTWGTDARNSKRNAKVQTSSPAAPAETGWYVMALGASAPTLVTATSNYWGPAAFSGDGKSLLLSYYDGSNYNVHSVKLDGSSLTPLTTNTDSADFAPVVYNNQILFNRYNNTSSSADIYLMDKSGNNQSLVLSTDSTWDSLNDTYWQQD